MEKLNNQIPMGVSQWRKHGKDYGYWDFFEKESLDKRNKEILKIIDDESEKWANEMKDRESAYGIDVFAQTIIDKIK